MMSHSDHGHTHDDSHGHLQGHSHGHAHGHAGNRGGEGLQVAGFLAFVFLLTYMGHLLYVRNLSFADILAGKAFVSASGHGGAGAGHPAGHSAGAGHETPAAEPGTDGGYE